MLEICARRTSQVLPGRAVLSRCVVLGEITIILRINTFSPTGVAASIIAGAPIPKPLVLWHYLVRQWLSDMLSVLEDGLSE